MMRSMVWRRSAGNVALTLGALMLSLVAAEVATRLIDGLPVFTDWLPYAVDRDAAPSHLDRVPRAAGVERAWYFTDPAPLPNRREPPAEWTRIAREIGEAPYYQQAAFRPYDYFKAWNAAFVREPCASPFFRESPGRLYLHRPSDGGVAPRYRLLPDATTPFGLVTNGIGWRGKPVEFRRGEKVVRIVFVGASTTLDNHFYPFSHPELIGHWLEQWAAARKLDVRFEVLNAGRESIDSTDIVGVVAKEVVPMRPDLVVYMEGANQFWMGSVVPKRPDARPPLLVQAETPQSFARFMQDASNRFALARRMRSAFGILNPGRGEEWPKPDYRLVWPPGVDELDPDLARPDLPVNLSVILRDLERMRADLATVGAELAVSSYKWMVHDGMVLDPVRHKGLIENLNITYFPYRYRDLERLADFQNRVFAKYARTHGLAFLDQAGALPRDPDLFTDSVHLTYGGIRLRGWIVLQMLVPIIERKLAAGAWPQPLPPAGEPPPGLFFKPEEIAFDCKAR